MPRIISIFPFSIDSSMVPWFLHGHLVWEANVVSVPPHAVQTYLVSRDIAINQFYQIWRVFTNCLTFGDEDHGFQKEN